MEPKIRPGDRVDTHLGVGRVIKVRGNGALVLIEKFGLDAHIELSKLTPIEPRITDQPPVTPAPTAQPRPALEPALVAIEALRFGLVPVSCIQTLTVDFGGIQDWVTEQLPNNRGGKATFSEVCGPFGAGKSHMMAVIRHVAEANGYVTGHVEVDAKKVSLSNPEGLLSSIWKSLKIEGRRSSTPLLDLYLKAIKGGNTSGKIVRYGIDRVRANYATAKLLVEDGLIDKYGPSLDAVVSSSSEVTATQLKGEISREPGISPWDLDVRRMIGIRVAERPYDFVESLAGHALLARLAGYRGLVITIDEFEVERLETRQWERVTELVQVLASYLKGDSKYPDAPLGIFVASVGQEGHVGDTLIDAVVKDVGGSQYELKSLTESQILELATKIHHLYCQAYGLPNEIGAPVVEEALGEARRSVEADSGLIRYVIKCIVSHCDTLYGPPNHGSPS